MEEKTKQKREYLFLAVGTKNKIQCNYWPSEFIAGFLRSFEASPQHDTTTTVLHRGAEVDSGTE